MHLKGLTYSLILLFYSTLITGQQIYSAANEVSFKRFSIEDGLSSKSLFNVYHDKDGFLWIPSTEGLSRFDGLNFQNFGTKHGLKRPEVGNVIQDKNKVLWVGCMAGVHIYKDRKFTSFDTSKKLPRRLMWSSYEDKDGTLWLGAGDGLFHVNPDNLNDPLIKHYIPSGNKDIRCVTRNYKGELVAGTEDGIYVIRNDSMILYGDHRCKGYNLVQVNDSTEWSCGWESNVTEFVNGKYKRDIALGSAILAITKTKDGNVWLASWDKGVFKYDGTNFYHYDHDQGLEYSSFWGCVADNDGNVWFSSWGKGLFLYSGERFTKLTDKSGLTNNNINGIQKGPDGKIWFSAENGLTYIDPANNNAKKSFTELNGVKLSKIICSVVMPNNEVLAFGYGGYGYRILNDKIKLDPNLSGFAALVTSKNELLVGREGAGAVWYRSNGQVDTLHLRIRKREFNSIERVFEDSKQNFWLCNFFQGINYFNGKVTICLNSKRGFINDAGTAVCDDIKGNVWIGTKGRGVFKVVFNTDTTVVIKDSITSVNGLLSNNINSLHIHKNKLYIGTDKGLNVLDIKLYEYDKSKTVRSYGKGEGFVDSETTIRYFEQNGTAWISTDQGAFQYDPRFDKLNTNEARTHILGIKLFLKDVDWYQYTDSLNNEGVPVTLTLPYDKNYLSFNYIGICLMSPNTVKYQFKLNGLNEEWSPETYSREAVFSSIPPGTYTFMVRSRNNDGVWNEKPKQFIFTILPPFWKTVWFNTIVLVVILLGIVLFVRYREKKLRETNMILETKVANRTTELKAALDQVEEKQKEIIDSFNYAQKIQSAYLPPEDVFHKVFSNAFLLFKPKDIVSGDFYWFYSLPKANEEGTTIFCAVADCTGHGVPGALMSVICCNALNDVVVSRQIYDTGMILNETRTFVKRSLKSTTYSGQKDGMDIALIKFDTQTKELWYSGAYNPLWILEDGKIIELQPDKQPIGVFENEKDFNVTYKQLKEKDIVYLFSDGYADQFGGPKGKKFKYRSLEDLLMASSNQSMEKQKEILINTLEKWRGDLEQVDDICIIGISI